VFSCAVIRPYQNSPLIFVLHRAVIEVEAACLPNIPAALFFIQTLLETCLRQNRLKTIHWS
jgi:hypothetical protein